jgi:hypothetical protein
VSLPEKGERETLPRGCRWCPGAFSAAKKWGQGEVDDAKCSAGSRAKKIAYCELKDGAVVDAVEPG